MPDHPVLTRCLALGWRRVAFIGLTKHAGKTTAMNSMITAVHEAGHTVGLCSIGLDGERLDSLLGVEKPAIYAPAGTLVASAEKALDQTNVQLEWLEELPIDSPLGPVMLARVTAPGQVLLAGIRQRKHVELVMPKLMLYGADFALVDGAFDRIAAASPHLVDAAVLAIGATAGKTPEEVVRRASPFLRRFQLPRTSLEWREKLAPAHDSGQIGVWTGQRLQLLPAHQSVLGLKLRLDDGNANAGFDADVSVAAAVNAAADAQARMGELAGAGEGSGKAVYLPGALTDGVCQELAMSPSQLEVVVHHPAQVLASATALRQLFRSFHRISVWTPLPLAAVAVNPHNILGYDMPWMSLATELAKLAPNLVFYDAVSGRTLQV